MIAHFLRNLCVPFATRHRTPPHFPTSTHESSPHPTAQMHDDPLVPVKLEFPLHKLPAETQSQIVDLVVLFHLEHHEKYTKYSLKS
jgi:hypothetical protein